MKGSKRMRTANKTMKLLALMIVILFTLTGCMRMNINYVMDDGNMKGEMILAMSPEILQMGEMGNTSGTGTETFEDLPEKEKLEMCKDNPLSEQTSGAPVTESETEISITEDGWLQCIYPIPETPVKDFDQKDENFTIKYDYASKQYDLQIFSPEDLGEAQAEMPPSMMAGMEFTASFTFPYLKEITVNGENAMKQEVDGVTVEKNTVTFDLMKIDGKEITVVGSDNSGLGVIIPILIAVLIFSLLAGLVIAAYFLIVKRNKPEEDENIIQEKWANNQQYADNQNQQQYDPNVPNYQQNMNMEQNDGWNNQQQSATSPKFQNTQNQGENWQHQPQWGQNQPQQGWNNQNMNMNNGWNGQQSPQNWNNGDQPMPRRAYPENPTMPDNGYPQQSWNNQGMWINNGWNNNQNKPAQGWNQQNMNNGFDPRRSANPQGQGNVGNVPQEKPEPKNPRDTPWKKMSDDELDSVVIEFAEGEDD